MCCEPEVNVPLGIRDQASWFLFVPTGITSHLQKRLNASWSHPRETNVLLVKISLCSTQVMLSRNAALRFLEGNF